jgi:hypothetical protein
VRLGGVHVDGIDLGGVRHTTPPLSYEQQLAIYAQQLAVYEQQMAAYQAQLRAINQTFANAVEAADEAYKAAIAQATTKSQILLAKTKWRAAIAALPVPVKPVKPPKGH